MISYGSPSADLFCFLEAAFDQRGDSGQRFLLVAAQPLNEPVARGGPFVMNTRTEVLQAFEDFRNGRF